jgi:hypothetical protein
MRVLPHLSRQHKFFAGENHSAPDASSTAHHGEIGTRDEHFNPNPNDPGFIAATSVDIHTLINTSLLRRP